jgi:hypothetical protein
MLSSRCKVVSTRYLQVVPVEVDCQSHLPVSAGSSVVPSRLGVIRVILLFLHLELLGTNPFSRLFEFIGLFTASVTWSYHQCVSM